MRKPLVQRYMSAFGRGIWGEVADRVVEGLVVVCGVLYLLSKAKFSWSKLIEGRSEAIIVGVWVTAALFVWHAFRAAYSVSAEIRRERPPESKILSAEGRPVEGRAPYGSPYLKLYGIALLLSGLSISACALVFLKYRGITAPPPAPPVPASAVGAPRAPTPPHHTKSDRFSTLIPVAAAIPNDPVPWDANVDDPKSDFYDDLASLSRRPDPPPPGTIFKPRQLTDQKQADQFVLQLVQYYILKKIRQLERGRQGIRFEGQFNGTAAVQQGVVPIDIPPVPVPDVIFYPAKTLMHDLGNNDFLNSYNLTMRSTNGGTPVSNYEQREITVWTHYPFPVPRGTVITMPSKQMDSGLAYVVQFERQSFYRLQFFAARLFISRGVLPKDFQTEVPGVDSYQCEITMNYDIRQRTDGGFDPASYEQWANDLFSGLKKAMAP